MTASWFTQKISCATSFCAKNFFLSGRLYHISGSSGHLGNERTSTFLRAKLYKPECKRSRDYKEATASAEAVIARQLNTRPACHLNSQRIRGDSSHTSARAAA